MEQEACGPSVIGSSRQPRESWLATQVAVRLVCARQARELPEM